MEQCQLSDWFWRNISEFSVQGMHILFCVFAYDLLTYLHQASTIFIWIQAVGDATHAGPKNQIT